VLKVLTESEQETVNLAFSFAKNLKSGDVIALEGDLGSGKTAFCRGICEGLGFAGAVNSPSYAIVHEYQNNPPIYHLDLYRLKSASDLYDTGIDGFSKGITLIEWPGSFSLNITHSIQIKIISENEREICCKSLSR
jgi:tRNA threonylcarbamoyladenosine biosynthesis protein TsaE